MLVSEVCAVYRVSDRGPTSVTDMPSKLHKLTNNTITYTNTNTGWIGMPLAKNASSARIESCEKDQI